MSDNDPIVDALALLRAETEALTAPPGLADAVLAEVARQPSPLWTAVTRGGRRMLLVGAVAGVLLSVGAARSVSLLEDRIADVALSGGL
jgi:hypothetical protein